MTPGPSDDAEYERLRELARQRMRAIVEAQARAHAEETASAVRPPPAIVVPNTK